MSYSSPPWVHIIGAGVAGLSLAAFLSQSSQLPGEVIISDPTFDRPKSQTFCFWYSPQTPLYIQPEHTWTEWSFSKDDHQMIHRGHQYQYGMISGEYLRTRLLNQIKNHPQIHLNPSAINTPPTADHVFDSRPPALEHFRVKQSFVGLEIELPHPHHITHVQLMHDLRDLEHGVEFRYVLPLSSHTLLVEYTRFTTQVSHLSDLEEADHLWVQNTFGLTSQPRHPQESYRIKRKEAAHIPMGLLDHGPHFGIPIGARAGMTRDATGYGLIEMQMWAKKAADLLISSNQALSYRPPVFRQWMDSCLLNIIEKRPDLMPSIFMTIARQLSADHFAGFMMNCTLSDALWMIRSAPKKPFLLSAMNKVEWT